MQEGDDMSEVIDDIEFSETNLEDGTGVDMFSVSSGE